MIYTMREHGSFDKTNLFTREGHPIFIIPRSSELKIDQLFELHGLKLALETIHLHELDESGSNISHSLVVSFGGTIDIYARLYAHLTNRRHVTLDKQTVVQKGLPDNTEVLLINSTDWNMTTLDIIRNDVTNRPEQMLGIIIGGDSEETYSEVIYRSLAVALSSPNTCQTITIDATREGTVEKHGGNVITGKNIQLADLTKYLSFGADILTISTHGDGYDASLSANHLICPYDKAIDEGSYFDFKPNCLKYKKCHRLDNSSLTEAWDSGNLIPPHTIKARVIFVEGCLTMPAQTGLFPSEIGFGFSMLRRAHSAVFLASSEVIQTNGFMQAKMLDLLLTEKYVGRAVRIFNQTDESMSVRRNLICFGDPKYMV